MLLYITGFMGSGKSSLFKAWSDDYTGASFDFDSELSSQLGIKDTELGSWIESNGWKAFRAEERGLLEKTLAEGQGLYSLGGGCLHANPDLVSVMDECGLRLLVDTPVETCWNRVSGDRNRPLVSQGKDEFFTLFSEREPLYRSANISISGEGALLSWEKFCNKYRDQLKLD